MLPARWVAEPPLLPCRQVIMANSNKWAREKAALERQQAELQVGPGAVDWLGGCACSVHLAGACR